jgi:SagB-type dehydrogenase family enzyme
VALPPASPTGSVSVEQALRARRSIREFRSAPLTLTEVAQLLWAAQGITDAEGHRTAPSAGAMYPLELYLAAAQVEGLPPGVYRYLPREHALEPVREGDIRTPLMAAALNQACVGAGPALLIFTAVYERTTGRYGDRGVRYVHMDVGHAGQNVHLQAVALGLGTVVVGAFDDDAVRRIIGAPANEEPLYIMPVGRV